MSAAPANALLSIADVLQLCRISRSTFWRIRRSGTFPPPIRISSRIQRFDSAAVDEYLASRRAVASP